MGSFSFSLCSRSCQNYTSSIQEVAGLLKMVFLDFLGNWCMSSLTWLCKKRYFCKSHEIFFLWPKELCFVMLKVTCNVLEVP